MKGKLRLLRLLSALVALLLIAPVAGAQAVATWNLTTDGSTSGAIYRSGGAAVQFAGAFDGASVAIEASAISGEWAKLFCVFDGGVDQEVLDAIVQEGWARCAVPNGLVRLTVSSAGASTDVKAVLVDLPRAALALFPTGGAGAASWGTIAGGTSSEDFLIDTGGSLGATGSGAVAATAVPWSGITSSPFSSSGSDLVQTQLGVGGNLLIRPNGGVGATDIAITPSLRRIKDVGSGDYLEFGGASGVSIVDGGIPGILIGSTWILGRLGGSGWYIHSAASGRNQSEDRLWQCSTVWGV